MITFDGVNKVFPDGTVAASNLNLEIPEGELVVFVGPSGCGKTTALRMVNRMIEPSSGRLYVNGKDAASMPLHELRRGIGYVIQQIGLFPNRTVAQNIGTVPKLLGWSKSAIAERTEELTRVVGLPEDVGERYPHQLSGGQRQRVGVARALAVDPPIMLMDEPFGAVDPIVRGRLQVEFLRLQSEVRKTIVFVTHDIDEAIRMGDRIAIFNTGGVLEQYASPGELLANPANDFVEGFLGGERELRSLALIPVSSVDAPRGPVVGMHDSTAQAELAAKTSGTDWVVVVDDEGVFEGWVSLADLDATQKMYQAPLQQAGLTVLSDQSLRTALNAMVRGGAGVAIQISPEKHLYEGIITQASITEALQ